VGAKLQAIAEERWQATFSSLAYGEEAAADLGESFSIPLTTVSRAGNFDASIHIYFASGSAEPTPLVVDSGNTMLIIPHWEPLADNPAYTVLGEAKEPWGSPAKVVRGPIMLLTADGCLFTIQDCVFYACTGEPRTANFGAGCIAPWSASSWNTPPGLDVVMQSPLAYGDYRYAEFVYNTAEEVLAESDGPTVCGGSTLVMHRSQPSGYTMLNILRDLAWMSVLPQDLTIAGTTTRWPGGASSPIAMVDTGGGPVLLSDPEGCVCDTPWPGAVPNPSWTSTSESCTSVNASLGITLHDGICLYAFTIDPARLPPSARGLTAVMCKMNAFLRNRQGMNLGGISALFNRILVDFAGGKVGFKPR
jgi:hypothetical protein